MRFDKFTIKAQKTIRESQNVAEKYDHQQIEPEHFLMAFLLSEEDIVIPSLQKLGVDTIKILLQLVQALVKIPKAHISGVGQPYISPRSKKILDQSLKEAERLKDDYVSTEHIFMAIADEKGGEASKILSSLGVTRDTIYTGLVEYSGELEIDKVAKKIA